MHRADVCGVRTSGRCLAAVTCQSTTPQPRISSRERPALAGRIELVLMSSWIASLGIAPTTRRRRRSCALVAASWTIGAAGSSSAWARLESVGSAAMARRRTRHRTAAKPWCLATPMTGTPELSVPSCRLLQPHQGRDATPRRRSEALRHTMSGSGPAARRLGGTVTAAHVVPDSLCRCQGGPHAGPPTNPQGGVREQGSLPHRDICHGWLRAPRWTPGARGAAAPPVRLPMASSAARVWQRRLGRGRRQRASLLMRVARLRVDPGASRASQHQ